MRINNHKGPKRRERKDVLRKRASFPVACIKTGGRNGRRTAKANGELYPSAWLLTRKPV